MRNLLIIALLVLASCSSDNSRDVHADNFKQMIEETSDAVVLDVRTAEEVEQGIIPGAIHIDYKKSDFESNLQRLDRDKTYFVYCGSGVRSAKALSVMDELGFRKIYSLEGGMKEWKEHGFEIRKK